MRPIVYDMPKLSAKLSLVYQSPVRIRGPYLCKDGRKRIDVIVKNKGKSCLLARAKLEVKLGRPLKKFETVDHIDGNKTNDRTKNLQVLTRKENASKAKDKIVQPLVKCAWCKTKFQLSKEQCKPSNRGKAGPFCSRSCSGKYGKQIQTGCPQQNRTKFKVERIIGV